MAVVSGVQMWCLPQLIFLAQVSLNGLCIEIAPPTLEKDRAMLAVATDQALLKGARRKHTMMGTRARSFPGHHQPMKRAVGILGLAAATH